MVRPAVGQFEDFVDGVQVAVAMGDEKRGAPLGDLGDVVDEFVGGGSVEVGSGLVQDEYGRVREEGTGKDQALALTADSRTPRSPTAVPSPAG